jgi:hypothetical protein
MSKKYLLNAYQNLFSFLLYLPNLNLSQSYSKDLKVKILSFKIKFPNLFIFNIIIFKIFSSFL